MKNLDYTLEKNLKYQQSLIRKKNEIIYRKWYETYMKNISYLKGNE